jgi:hypothetical protein
LKRGRLRWVLEIHAALNNTHDPSGLGPGVLAAAQTDGTTKSVAAALRLVESLPGGAAARPIIDALENAPAPPLSPVRRALRRRLGVRPPG